MRTVLVVAGVLAAVSAAGAAVGQQAPAPPRGYLSKETAPNAAAFLPPPPVVGDDLYADDRAAFKATRTLKDTPRWKVAQDDNDTRSAALLSAFTCTIGSKVTPENAPLTARLISRVAADAGMVAGTAQDRLKRQRPFVIDPGDICIEKTDRLAASFDYPSGHTAIGWAVGLLLAELAPDRTNAVLTRGRAYGESRVVCGVHNASSIEASRMVGSAVIAALNGSAEFRVDADAARAELAAVRADKANAVTPAICGAEHGVLGATPYPR